MIRGLRQLRAVWASRAVKFGVADIGSDVIVRGLKLLRRHKRTGKLGRFLRGRKMGNTLAGVDIATTAGWAGLGVAEYSYIKKRDRERQAAVRKFKKRLDSTKFEIVRRAK